MKNKKLVFILIALVVTLVIIGAGYAFAYYFDTPTAEERPNFNTDTQDNEQSIYEIGSEKALITYTKDTLYNPHHLVSDNTLAGARQILKFTDNITLSSNLMITADIGLYLNGYRLNLNGYSITIHHTYSGSFTLEMGEIELDSGWIYVYLENADFIINECTFLQDNQPIDIEDYPTKLVAEKWFIAYNALYQATSILLNETQTLAPKIGSIDLGAEIVADENGVYYYNLNLFTPHNSNFFVVDDIDLPFSYKGYGDYTISYQSSAPNIVSNTGKVTPLQAESEDIVLTAQVFYKNVLIGKTTFNITLLSLTSPNNALNLAGRQLIEDYLQKYLQLDEADQPFYSFNNDIVLPKSLPGYDVEYNYHVYMVDENQQEIKIDNAISEKDGVYLLDSLFNATILDIQVYAGGILGTKRYSILCNADGSAQTHYTISQDLANLWYSGRIYILENTELSEENPQLYNNVELYTVVPELYAAKGVIGIEYSLINDVNNLYEIVNVGGQTLLTVLPGKDPINFLDAVVLNMKVTYDTTPQTSINLLLPIQVKLAHDPGDNVHEFYPYYIFYNGMFLSSTGGYTLTDFTMPLYYGGGRRVIAYDISPQGTNFINTYIIYNDLYNQEVRIPIIRGEGQNIGDAFDEAIGQIFKDGSESEPLQIADLISYGAKWLFEFDIQLIPKTDTPITIEYYYQSITMETDSWIYYTSISGLEEEGEEDEFNTYTSHFTIPGILRKDNSGIEDELLYEWVFNTFNPENENYQLGSIILTSWLEQDLGIGNLSPPTGIVSYKGIEYLKNTTRIKISNTGITNKNQLVEQIIDYILKMPSLRELDLSGNGISDRVGGSANGAGNNLISEIAKTQVEVLRLSYNSIYDFTGLEAMPSLKKLYNNHNIYYSLNSIFYGSSGLVNTASYANLAQRGVEVYNYASGAMGSEDFILFEADASASDYINLLSIEYQKKLKAGVDISVIWATLSKDYRDYGLSTSYSYFQNANSTTLSTANVVTTGTNAPKIVFTPYTDTALGITKNNTTKFTLTYTFRVSGNSTDIVLTIDFEVQRI